MTVSESKRKVRLKYIKAIYSEHHHVLSLILRDLWPHDVTAPLNISDGYKRTKRNERDA